MSNVRERVMELLVDICGTKKVVKDFKANIMEQGYLDSMGICELLESIEEDFGMEIPLENFEPDMFSSIEKIVYYIEKNAKIAED